MTPTYGQRLLTEFMARKQAKGANLCSEEIVSAADDMVGVFLAEERKKWEAAKKARNKAELHPSTDAVLNAYPRRQGGEAGRVAISKAIAQDGLEKVLAGTTEYASAVARWSHGRRVSQSGSSLIPLPGTWFGNRCYCDDPKYWWEGTGGKQKAEEKKPTLPEPSNWRTQFPDFLHVHSRWENIDPVSQAYICEQMKTKQHTA